MEKTSHKKASANTAASRLPAAAPPIKRDVIQTALAAFFDENVGIICARALVRPIDREFLRRSLAARFRTATRT